jgi:hypothetical protein
MHITPEKLAIIEAANKATEAERGYGADLDAVAAESAAAEATAEDVTSTTAPAAEVTNG